MVIHETATIRIAPDGLHRGLTDSGIDDLLGVRKGVIARTVNRRIRGVGPD
ncbi:hypothetical protein [Aureimonas sp. AU4]|uniref:hypothetical protein n=1 Tax=Aureimonas sp. AU4 TaxID=1638163 RepID=UPI0007059402|nr:hypothetical protein [Aureimonas sp. AU4]BAT30666.1 hypothetical protein [Aureimonas sp. AU4]